ncbi:MAG: hypothetical protein HUJ25_04480 [Crocinitomicaceae bacterium]|nr:hypothetical protein [Crocinitomicaceae bacterium]
MKKISTSMYRRVILVSLFILMCNLVLAQKDTGFFKVPYDTSTSKLNMDAVYNRPFLTHKKVPVAVGGYLEANSIYTINDGITDGLSFQARRLTLFLSSSIKNRLKFLTELEFEDGTKEIAIEFAALDLTIHPLLNFRGGIIMNPIGAFNQNHDGPKWEFVERPDVSTGIVPATWSNAGFGIYGKTNKNNWVFGYELYVSNGFDDRIIDNEENKTYLPASKDTEERFEENNSGLPMISGKVAIKNRKFGEIGLSYMGGVYNKFEADGLMLDKKRRVDVAAFDLNFTIPKINTNIIGEAVYAYIDVPGSYTQQFGESQWGMFVDFVQPVYRPKWFKWENSTLNLAMRFDYVDWNMGMFNGTTTLIGDNLMAITPAVSFRPSPQTVFRLNYRYSWQKDIVNNPAALSSSWIFGFSTYF